MKNLTTIFLIASLCTFTPTLLAHGQHGSDNPSGNTRDDMIRYLNKQEVVSVWRILNNGKQVENRITTFGDHSLAHPIAICALSQHFSDVYVSITVNVKQINGNRLTTVYQCNDVLQFNKQEDIKI